MLKKALVRAVAKLQGALEKGLISDFALIGGFAVSAWGYPRATDDIDFAIQLDRVNIKALSKFLPAKLRLGDSTDPLIATYDFEIESHLVQLIVFPNNWDKIAFSSVQQIEMEGHQIPLADWKAMVLLKLYAGSPSDLYDAKRIIEVQDPGQRAIKALREKAKLLRVSKKFDLALAIKR